MFNNVCSVEDHNNVVTTVEPEQHAHGSGMDDDGDAIHCTLHAVHCTYLSVGTEQIRL